MTQESDFQSQLEIRDELIEIIRQHSSSLCDEIRARFDEMGKLVKILEEYRQLKVCLEEKRAMTAVFDQLKKHLVHEVYKGARDCIDDMMRRSHDSWRARIEDIETSLNHSDSRSSV